MDVWLPVVIDKLCTSKLYRNRDIGHVNEDPTAHYIGNPRHTESIIAYVILISGKSSEKLHCGNVEKLPIISKQGYQDPDPLM